MFHLLGRWLFHATNATALIAGAMICIMMLQVTADVVGRYLFNAPLPATIVFVSHYYMLFVVFLPLAMPERTNGHISVEIVTERLPRRVQYHLASCLHLLGSLIYGAIAWASLGEAMSKFATSARLIEGGFAILIWPSYFLVPIGSALIAIVLLYRFLAYALRLESGLGETPVSGASAARRETLS